MGYKYIFHRLSYARLLKGLSDHSLKAQLWRLGGVLLSLLAMHAVAMVYLEGLSWNDSIWLTLTTVNTVGYGDFSAQTVAGRAVSIILIYGAGIAILAQLAGLYFEYRQDKRQSILNGHWRWGMQDHIVFLNSPRENAERYFEQVLKQLRKSLEGGIADRAVIIVSDQFDSGLPAALRAMNVVHVNSHVAEGRAFVDSSLSAARVVVALSLDEGDLLSDSVNFDLVSRVREANESAMIVAEAVDDGNRDRLKQAGADHVIRPIRSYPELLARTILAPGSEHIIEDMFNSIGEECVKYDVSFEGAWGEIAGRCIVRDIGTPLAYQDAQGHVIANPRPDSIVDARALYVIVRAENLKSVDAVSAAISG